MPKTWTLAKVLPWLLIICGSIGLLMSGIIMIDKIRLLQDPAFVPGCDLNPVVACGSVMESAQADAFGVPNPIIGLAAFPVLIATGAALLAGARLKRWYWLGLQAGTIFGLGFVHWLFYQSTYNIGAICPYCVVVWIVTITSFWYVLLYNIREKHIRLPKSLQGAGAFVQRHHLDMLLLWFIGIAALLLNQFWYYYGPLLGF